VHQSFINFAGQPCARLTREQAVYAVPRRRRSLRIKLISPVLFFAPDSDLADLETAWIDEVINPMSWKALISDLSDEWKEAVLYATVLLSSNTALLAVPDVDNGFQKDRNLVQILCYASIIMGSASIILGLLLIKYVYCYKYSASFRIMTLVQTIQDEDTRHSRGCGGLFAQDAASD
jgi:hypothetical protein